MHEGHRARMREKLENNADALFDHELLEILLYNAYPRINTNGIAHKLLDSFGSISGVLAASAEELTATEGVGKNVADYLKCVDGVLRRVNSENNGVAVLKSFEDFKKFTAMRLRGKVEEVLELYCLEKSGKIKRIFTFTSNEINRVEIETQKLASAVAVVKPHGIIIAHNHLTGSPEPSGNDDRFTAEAQVICSVNNVNLYDHCIYSSEKIYSYFCSGRIDMIKRNYSFDRLVDGQYKKDISENNFRK